MTNILQEKVIATFVGCAIGDALGMPVEGWPKERIKKHCGRIIEMLDPIILKDAEGNILSEDEFGVIHHWTDAFSKGEYTDDTILTLAIAESIAERGLPDLHHICQTQLKIYLDFSQGRSKCGFGGTTKDAFENLLSGVSPTKSGVIGGPGTGPPMKMSPIGLWMAMGQPLGHLGWKDRLRPGQYFAKLIGNSTHLDPRSWLCGILMADAIWRCAILDIKEGNKLFFLQEQFALAEKWYRPVTEEYTWHTKGDILKRLNWICNNLDVSVEEAHTYLGSSSAVYKAYPFVLWVFQKYWNNPIEGLIELVNCGGDCDTTGAMYGALVGARHGMIFPDNLKLGLKNLDYVVSVGERFYDSCYEG